MKESSEFWPAEGLKQSHGLFQSVQSTLTIRSSSHTIPLLQGGSKSMEELHIPLRTVRKCPPKCTAFERPVKFCVLTPCLQTCQQILLTHFNCEVLPWNSETPESLGESSSQSVSSLVPRMLLRNCFPPFTFQVPVATRTRLELVNSNWRSDMAFKILGVTDRRGQREKWCVKEECAIKGKKQSRQQQHSHCEIMTLP